MSARDKVRSFAESREADHVVIRDGLTYGDARELLAELSRRVPAPGGMTRVEELEGALRAVLEWFIKKHDAEGKVLFCESCCRFSDDPTGWHTTTELRLEKRMPCILITRALTATPSAGDAPGRGDYGDNNPGTPEEIAALFEHGEKLLARMKASAQPTPPSAPTGAPAFKLCARCGKSTGLAASAEGRRHCSMECATADADEQTAAGLDADLDDARQARRFARDYEPAPSAPREGAARGEGADYERGRADRERELLAEAKAFGDERGRSAASTGGMLKQRRLGAADAMWWFVRCVQEGKSLMDRDGVTLAHVDDEDYEPTPSPAPTPPPGEGEVSHVHGCDCPECVEWRQEQRDSAPTPCGLRDDEGKR